MTRFFTRVPHLGSRATSQAKGLGSMEAASDPAILSAIQVGHVRCLTVRILELLVSRLTVLAGYKAIIFPSSASLTFQTLSAH